jgi:phenylacetate-CoA ligase
MIAPIRELTKNLPFPVHLGYGWVKRKIFPKPEIWKNEVFRHYDQWLDETQWWSKEQLLDLQLSEMHSLINHAFENVPFYRRIFEERKLKPKDILTIDDLQKLPIITKSDISENLNDMMAKNFDRNRLEYAETSGTTGKPLLFYYEKGISTNRDRAFMLRQWKWAGYKFKDSVVVLRGGRLSGENSKNQRSYWDYRVDTNELHLSTMDMNDENMTLYAKMIREFKPKFIFAYPSSIDIFARFLLKVGITDIKLKAIFCESETLYPQLRQTVKPLFGCEIFSGYGHSERAVDAVECDHHAGYHLCMEYGILELVKKNNEVITDPGKIGRVVATGFGSYCMPLIRYATDDLTKYALQDCTCNRHSTLLQNIYGRIQEFLVSRSGYLVPFISDIFYRTQLVDNIICYKFIQKRQGELILQIQAVTSASKEKIKQVVLEAIFQNLDENEFTVTLEFVNEIARSTRGKLNYFEQRLPIKFDDLDLSR